MATYTPNLNLIKPAGTDYVRVSDFNENANVLDASIGDLGQLETDEKASLVLAINEAALRGGENAPYIDDTTGNWMMWDFGTAQYVDSGVKAEGADGSDGADGISAFVWIKWSAIQPTQNSDMKDTPDQFIGVYSGTSPTAPAAYTSYQWYKYKGDAGVYLGETEPIDESVNVWIDPTGDHSVAYDPVPATEDMRLSVGVDNDGKLYAEGAVAASDLPIAPIIGVTAQNTQEALEQLAAQSAIHRYGILWNGATAQCTRLWDAAGITTDTTHFCHRGEVDASYNNPFDNLMPWAGRRVCNINMAGYIAMHTAGAGNILDAVSAWEGDPDFKWDGTNGPVMVYTPEFWQYSEKAGAGQILGVADGPLLGWAHVPAHIGGRWWGVDDGDNSLTSKPGIPLINIAASTLHTRAKAKKMTLDNIYTYSADTLLLCVEYGTLNTQTAIGNGDASSYRQAADRPAFAETSVNRVILTDAQAAYYRVEALLDIGTSGGAYDVARRVVTSKTPHSEGYTAINFSGEAVSITTAHYVSAHGIVNTEDSALGSASGYIGQNGYCHAYYRGAAAHAGRLQYILGAYRQKDTARIWVAASAKDADNYDALDTTKHINTGLILPQGADGAAASGYIGEMHHFAVLPSAPFCKALGGSSANPVGDSSYTPTLATADTILLCGGAANNGVTAGRFCANWGIPASNTGWDVAARPLLKSPQGGS